VNPDSTGELKFLGFGLEEETIVSVRRRAARKAVGSRISVATKIRLPRPGTQPPDGRWKTVWLPRHSHDPSRAAET